MIGSGADASLASAVAAIGKAGFDREFHRTLRAIMGADMSSVFHCDPDGATRLILSGSEHPAIPDFSFRASQAYGERYWRSDREIIRACRSATRAPALVRMRAGSILDPQWRKHCYEDAGVVERISIVGPGSPRLLINGYRLAESGPFTAADIERAEDLASILLALLRRHVELCQSDAAPTDEKALTHSLAEARYGLSLREAQIASAMMLGHTQKEIAERRRLAHATVVTYRRRAYQKLGVRNRRELASLHRQFLSNRCAHPA